MTWAESAAAEIGRIDGIWHAIACHGVTLEPGLRHSESWATLEA